METKFLSIVIPYYQETKEEMFALLSVINNQTGVDLNQVEVILVNDGNGNKLPKSFLSTFTKIDIRTILMPENKGSGIARQVGLDAAKGHYVTFCDADDTLHSVVSLAMMIQELVNYQPDVSILNWLEERKHPSGAWLYNEHQDDRTWMFGKAFKVSFLRGNNIRFHEDLRVQEDSYFNSLACELAQSVRITDQIVYIWKYREKSITRKDDHAYSFWSFSEYIKSVCYAIKELHNRAIYTNLPHKVAQLLVYAFFALHQARWQDEEVAKYRKESEDMLVERLTPYLDYFTGLPGETVREIYSTERERTFQNEMETEFFSDWLQRIGFNREVTICG